MYEVVRTRYSGSVIRATILFILGLSVSCATSHEIRYRLSQEAAINTMKQIRESQIAFKKAEGRYGDLVELQKAELLSREIKEGISHGFIFKITFNESSYKATAIPESFSRDFSQSSGAISLYLDETGVIRKAFREGKEATIDDEPLS